MLLAKKHGMSLRTACALIGISRTGFRYRPKHAERDAALSKSLKALSREHPRWGYRFASAVLIRTCPDATRRRVYRLWRALGLQVPYRRKRRKIRTGAQNKPVATHPNTVWAWDFVFDSCAGGRQLKCFNVVDESTRECLAIDVEHSIRSGRVLQVLAALIKQYGQPQYIRSDNGPEFIAKKSRGWMEKNRIKTAYIEPGKPCRIPLRRASTADFATST